MKSQKHLFSTPLALFVNLFWVYVAYFLCRVIFILENYGIYVDNLSFASLMEMFRGGWMFDTSAILYTNALYIVMMLFPIHYKETSVYRNIAKGVYLVVNGLCVVMNLADSVYFQFTGRRTTVTVFSEFSNENNLGGILGIELLRHWYLTLAGILIIFALFRLYRMPRERKPRPSVAYYALHSVILLVCIPFCVFGMRGGATTAVRPITISNANQYVDRPVEAAIVLNTPFSLIRTFNKKVFVDPAYFPESELDKIYTPVHQPPQGVVFKPKNVVVLIVESFAREYIGALNKDLEGGTYKGYTPFVDSLIAHSRTYRYSFCNGRRSIDAMPSILSGIPMFVETFFLTPASLNTVSGLAGELKTKGYYSAFFHGAENGSMGFEAFARTSGFTDYFGRTEFDKDSRYGGEKDFDGTWAIWDEPFLQFYCDKMNEFKEPFMTAVFTASSHHPYVVPDKYKSTFPEEGLSIHKCIRYTDHSLKRFFEKASKQAWFKNTLFVLTCDHTNQTDHKEFQTDLGCFRGPIIFYAPGDSTVTGYKDAIAQQADIMPSVLGYLGYDKPFISFGCDLFHTPDEDTYAVNYLDGTYQYVKGPYLLQFDGDRTRAVYRFATDPLLKENLVGKVRGQEKMERELKAIIQQYMSRMVTDRIAVRHDDNDKKTSR